MQLPMEEIPPKKRFRPLGFLKGLFTPPYDSCLPPPRMSRSDWALLLSLTLIYAALAFFRLGTFDIPQTLFFTPKDYSTFTFQLEQPEELEYVYIYKWWGNGKCTVKTSDSPDGPWEEAGKYDIGQHMQWCLFKIEEPKTTQYVELEIGYKNMELAEICFTKTGSSEPLPVTLIGPMNDPLFPPEETAALLDEQHMLDYSVPFYSLAYFDEFLYNTTAYGFLNGLPEYMHELTHPPLGKVIMMGGIALFGMNSIGWRVTGALTGVLMLPVLYFLARRLFRNNRWAFTATLLMAFDFMHFSQTRMSTIDSYPVLFILMAYLFMMRFYQSRSRGQEALSLFLSGASWGLAVASKWIGIYAGVGLCLMFFYFLQVKSRHRLDQGRRAAGYAVGNIAWCLPFFIIIPVLIYVASYIPFMNLPGDGYDLKGVWENQVHMLTFHENVKDEFSFASPWWAWPFDYQPLSLISSRIESQKLVATVLTLGNPILCWGGIVAFFWTLVLWFKRREPGMLVALVGFATQYLPWAFIDRPLFIYHYFAPLMFLILCICFTLRDICERWYYGYRAAYIFVGLTAILFIAFFPMLSALYVPEWYAYLL